MLESAGSPPLFTLTSLYSLAGVALITAVAVAGSKTLLPKKAGWVDKATFIWLAFDGLIHFFYEGSFLYLSTLSEAGTVNGSSGAFAEMWKEYAKADERWGFSDPVVVSLELLTVLGAGPLCFYIIYQLIKGDQARHYWIVVLSTAELYGGWMTFCPEWLTGSKYLNTGFWLYYYVYLIFMNVIWVVIPLALMVDSYGAIAGALRASSTKKKTS